MSIEKHVLFISFTKQNGYIFTPNFFFELTEGYDKNKHSQTIVADYSNILSYSAHSTDNMHNVDFVDSYLGLFIFILDLDRDLISDPNPKTTTGDFDLGELRKLLGAKLNIIENKKNVALQSLDRDKIAKPLLETLSFLDKSGETNHLKVQEVFKAVLRAKSEYIKCIIDSFIDRENNEAKNQIPTDYSFHWTAMPASKINIGEEKQNSKEEVSISEEDSSILKKLTIVGSAGGIGGWP